jgi:hypothetical protein
LEERRPATGLAARRAHGILATADVRHFVAIESEARSGMPLAKPQRLRAGNDLVGQMLQRSKQLANLNTAKD